MYGTEIGISQIPAKELIGLATLKGSVTAKLLSLSGSGAETTTAGGQPRAAEPWCAGRTKKLFVRAVASVRLHAHDTKDIKLQIWSRSKLAFCAANQVSSD